MKSAQNHKSFRKCNENNTEIALYVLKGLKLKSAHIKYWQGWGGNGILIHFWWKCKRNNHLKSELGSFFKS